MSKGMEEDDFHATVQPAIANLFAVNDRGVRVMLLTNIPLYAKRLEDKVVNDQASVSLLLVGCLPGCCAGAGAVGSVVIFAGVCLCGCDVGVVAVGCAVRGVFVAVVVYVDDGRGVGGGVVFVLLLLFLLLLVVTTEVLLLVLVLVGLLLPLSLLLLE